MQKTGGGGGGGRGGGEGWIDHRATKIFASFCKKKWRLVLLHISCSRNH